MTTSAETVSTRRMKRSSPWVHSYFTSGRYSMEHMANILTASMVCCPYVMVGLGQAIIVGAHSAGRTAHATAEDAVREIPLATFDKEVQTSRTDDKRGKVCFIPGCAVFALR